MHARWFASGVLIPLIGGFIIHSIVERQQQMSSAPTHTTLPPLTPLVMPKSELPQLTPPIVQPSTIPKPLGDTVEFVVRRNDTMDRIFRQLKLSLTDLASIRDLPEVRQSLDRLRPGDTITVVHDEGLLQALTRRISETEVLTV